MIPLSSVRLGSKSLILTLVYLRFLFSLSPYHPHSDPSLSPLFHLSLETTVNRGKLHSFDTHFLNKDNSSTFTNQPPQPYPIF